MGACFGKRSNSLFSPTKGQETSHRGVGSLSDLQSFSKSTSAAMSTNEGATPTTCKAITFNQFRFSNPTEGSSLATPTPTLKTDNEELPVLVKNFRAATFTQKGPLRLAIMAFFLLGLAEDPALELEWVSEFPFIVIAPTESEEFEWVFLLWTRITHIVQTQLGLLSETQLPSQHKAATSTNKPTFKGLARQIVAETRTASQTLSTMIATARKAGLIIADPTLSEHECVNELNWVGAFSLLK